VQVVEVEFSGRRKGFVWVYSGLDVEGCWLFHHAVPAPTALLGVSCTTLPKTSSISPW
jgi:hypothetical protein